MAARTEAYGKEWRLDVIDILPYEKNAMWLESHQIGDATAAENPPPSMASSDPSLRNTNAASGGD